MIAVVVYIYVLFRHSIKIPTAAEYIEMLSPGMQQATTGTEKLVFWFYSLSEQRYRMYTLAAENMVVALVTEARAPRQCEDFSKGFYFNFGKQRWERKVRIGQPVLVDDLVTTNIKSIEQKYTLCHLTADNEEVCTDMVDQTFVKMRIRDVDYRWQNNTLQRTTPNYFPTTGDRCKFTVNRYKQYLGIDSTDEAAQVHDNTEQDIGIYFERLHNGIWQLQECKPSVETMQFDGEGCRPRAIAFPLVPSVLLRRSNELLPTGVVGEDDNKLITSTHEHIEGYWVRLNSSHSMHINLNVLDKKYPLDVDFYKSCWKSLFLMGVISNDTYKWSIQQILDNTYRQTVLDIQQQYCPILDEPYRIFYVRTGETLPVERPFIVYRNMIFYLFEYLSPLITMLVTRLVPMTDKMDELMLAATENAVVSDNHLLPKVRKLIIENRHSDECQVYVTSCGKTIMDVFIETRLLVDYLEDMHKYDFFQRATFPIIEDDFNVATWSCANNEIADMDMFTYISLVDMYTGLAEYATTSQSIL